MGFYSDLLIELVGNDPANGIYAGQVFFGDNLDLFIVGIDEYIKALVKKRQKFNKLFNSCIDQKEKAFYQEQIRKLNNQDYCWTYSQFLGAFQVRFISDETLEKDSFSREMALNRFYDKIDREYSNWQTRNKSIRTEQLVKKMPGAKEQIKAPNYFTLITRQDEKIYNAKTHEAFFGKYSPDVQGFASFLKKNWPVLAKAFFRPRPVYLPEKYRERHTFILGQSGSGKSELMKVLISSQVPRINKKKQTVILIDPHGDLAEQVIKLETIYNDKINVAYIDPYLSGARMTPSINPFEIREKTEQAIDIQSQELTRVFQELIKDTKLSLQMEALLIPCIATILRRPNSDIFTLQRFMNDDDNDDLVSLGKQSPNKAHANFFRSVFLETAYKSTKLSIFTKLQSLLNSSTFAKLLSNGNTIDIEEFSSKGGCLVFNLARGKMGADASDAFGRFVVAMLQSMALRRAEKPHTQRTPIHLFIDECQNYISPSIEIILTEARKYGLHLTMTSQVLGQKIDTKLKNIILSNTAIKLVGMNAQQTLKAMATELGEKIEEFKRLRIGEFYAKCGPNEPYKLKVDNKLVGGRCSVSSDFWQKIKAEMLDKYYIKPDQQRDQKTQETEQRPTERETELKPMFELE